MDDDLARTAQRWGIEPGFWDVKGQWREATSEAIERIAAALSASGQPPASWSLEPPAPEPAFQGDGRRGWVLAVQLYAVRSRRNWGHGDFTDLAALLELAAEAGAAGVGLNPLHALFMDRPEDASPYAPNSRLFLNPLYIDLEAVPDFPPAYAAEAADRIETLRRAELVDYAGVAALKGPALRLAHRAFRAGADGARREDFARFCREHGAALDRFAAFEVLRRRHPGPWWEWPEPWRSPDEAALARLKDEAAEEFEFHQYVQWIAERQLHACSDAARRRGMPVGLYIDLAVGVDPSGADGWIAQDAMLRGLSVGAPPDEYNPAGQDWGLTTFDPHGLVRQDFAPLREMLRSAMRHAGAIRIDHVLGFMRLYVIPRGRKPRDGAYLRVPFFDMLRAAAQESRAQRCVVIGEDLGTVPENFRETMAAWGLWSYLVMLFEREWDGAFRHPSHYKADALATFGTHDLPTFAGWMSGGDLARKRALGVDPGESDEDRERSRASLRQAIGGEGGFLDVVNFLAATPTRLVSVAVEDVLGVADQVNMPGTVREYPNWRRRLPLALEDLRGDQRLRDIGAAFSRAGRAAGAGG